jgi:hypothetical protein
MSKFNVRNDQTEMAKQDGYLGSTVSQNGKTKRSSWINSGIIFFWLLLFGNQSILVHAANCWLSQAIIG